MKESLFQFTAPELKSLTFSITENFHSENKTISLETKISSHLFNVKQEGEDASASVEVSVTIGKPDGSQPFYIDAIEAANFKWPSGFYTNDEINTLLKKNATALLISYLRPIISNITGYSRYPSYNLPYVDLTNHE